jgi:hypothetical protein
LERSVSEVFAKCWTLYESRSLAPTASESSSAGATGGAEKGTGEKAGKTEKQSNEKRKSEQEPKDLEKPASEKQNRTKSPVELAFAEALDVKKLMISAMTSAKSILESVEADHPWKDLAGATDRLRSTVTAVQSAMTPFARAFLSLTTMQVKKDFPDAITLKTELQQFTCTFKEIVASCDYESRKLVAMQQAAKSLSKKA